MGSGLEISVFSVNHLADRRVMNPKCLRNLLQRVAMRAIGVLDQMVTFLLSDFRFFRRENICNSGTPHMALRSGDLRDFLTSADHFLRLLNKTFSPKDDLPGEFLPRGLTDSHPLFYELTIKTTRLRQ